MEQTQKYCQRCKSQELHARPATSHLLHLIITVFLCGFWIPIWILSSLKIGGWRCQRCGTVPNQAAQSILALVLIVCGGVFVFKKCSNSSRGSGYTPEVKPLSVKSESLTIDSDEDKLPPAPLRTTFDKPKANSPDTIEAASENEAVPTPEIVQPAPPIPEVRPYLKTLEGIPLPVVLVVDEDIILLDAAGQDATIEVGQKILVTDRRAGGTLNITVGQKTFVGNESRLSDKVRIDGK